MADALIIPGSVVINGPAYLQDTISLPNACVTDDHVTATAAIDASKLDHQYALQLNTAAGEAVADVTRIVHVAKAAGQLVAVKCCLDVTNVGDSTISVDVQKSTGAGAFSSMLDAAETLSSSTAAKTAVDATIGSGAAIAYAAGDLIEIEVDATVGTGTLGQGLCVVAYVREAA